VDSAAGISSSLVGASDTALRLIDSYADPPGYFRVADDPDIEKRKGVFQD
jgi:hypothetical protein